MLHLTKRVVIRSLMCSKSVTAKFPLLFLPPFSGINSVMKEFVPHGANFFFNSIALKTAKTLLSFGRSECNRVK